MLRNRWGCECCKDDNTPFHEKPEIKKNIHPIKIKNNPTNTFNPENNPTNTFNPVFTPTFNPVFSPIINVTGCCDDCPPQPPTDECECSGFLRDNFEIVDADICTNCELEGSTVTVFPDNPESRRVGTVTSVSCSNGTLIATGSGTFQGEDYVFTLSLFENTGTANDAFNYAEFSENGNITTIANTIVPESNLVVAPCPPSGNPAINLTLPAVESQLEKNPDISIIVNGKNFQT